jgi:hypothetical protein
MPNLTTENAPLPRSLVNVYVSLNFFLTWDAASPVNTRIFIFSYTFVSKYQYISNTYEYIHMCIHIYILVCY